MVTLPIQSPKLARFLESTLNASLKYGRRFARKKRQCKKNRKRYSWKTPEPALKEIMVELEQEIYRSFAMTALHVRRSQPTALSERF